MGIFDQKVELVLYLMIVYVLLTVVMLLLSIIELCNNGLTKMVRCLVVTLLIVLLGFRYEVGNDYQNYVETFQNLDWYKDVFEPGYIFLCQFSQKLNLTYQFPFFICSLLTVLPIAFLVNKTIPRMFCTSMTVYVLSYVYFEAMNTVRQAVAMSAFLLVFYFYIIQEQKLKALLALIFGALFHKSILIIAFLAFIMSKFRDKFNIKLCLILLLGSFVIGHCLQSFFDAISGLTMLLGLNSNYMDVFEERGVASGTFQIYLNISALYLLIFNKKQFSPKNRRNQIIALFYVAGIVIYNVFISFYIGLRFYWYFYLFLILVIPNLLKKRKIKIRPLFFIVLVLIITIYTFVSLQSKYYIDYNMNFSLF